MSFELIEPEKLYAKDPQLKKQDVNTLQEWLNEQPHLPKLLEIQALIFLHSCYYNLEHAKITIDHYFTIRHSCPDVFTALTPDDLKTTTSVSFVNILPKTTPEGYAILATKLLDTKASNFSCVNHLNLTNMVATLYMHQNGFANGAIALFDMQGFSFRHLFKINVNAVRHALYHLQKGAPVRIKGIHVINAVPLTDKIIALLKPFLQSGLYNMIHCHPPNAESLYEVVPKDCLPEEYGGELPSVKTLNEDNLQNLLDNYSFYEWHDNQRLDESKRPEGRK